MSRSGQRTHHPLGSSRGGQRVPLREEGGVFEQLPLFDHAAVEPLDPLLPCADCGVSTLEVREIYVVCDEVWTDAGMGPEGSLCVGCLEARLARRLGSADFTDAPVTASPFQRSQKRGLPPVQHSSRLANRLGHIA